MKILVAAATPIEISPFLKQLREDPLLFSNTDVLITGIGLTATTYTLSKQFQIYKPDLVIQAGVGGCFDKTKPLGTVVAVKQETIADQSIIEINQLKTLFDLKLIPHNQFPYRNGWLINKNELLKNIKLQKVKGISVNEITTTRKKMIFYEKHFSPVVESMEGAALHYTCLMENIPFIQIRAMSNYIAERNKKKWNMKESVDNLNKELDKILKNINS